jgi:hypothetical protein
MNRPYSPKNFLRQVPNHLLQVFFAQRSALADIPWELHNETEIGMIFDAWQALPPARREEVDRAFQAVHEMACAEGVQALIEEGNFHRLNLAVALERYEGFYHKAMWAYLNHHSIFNVASLFVSADGLPQRYWFRHKNLPRKPPDTSASAARALADELSEYYKENQGRGHRCTVETYLRAGRQHYFFAYPDDYVDTFIGHDDAGEFIKRPQKRAFEVVFVYEPEAGTLDLYVQGDRRVRARVLYIFCSVVLNENPPPEEPGDHPYELNALLSRDFPFATDPEDGIEEVRIRKMRLSLGSGRRRITLEADPQAGPQDIYELIAECLHPTFLASAVVNVTNAEFQFRFAARGYEKPKPITFSVSFPNSSNLKSLPESRRLLVEKYLKRWGIERD